MSSVLKKCITLITAVFIVLSAFVLMPPVDASAASTIKYSVSYSGDYVKLTLSPKKSTDTIYYTTNGSNATKKSTVYKKPLASAAKVRIKAVEYNKSGSKVASIDITVAPKVRTPEFTVSTSGGQKYLKIKCATSGAKIYYTTDGSTPSKSSKLYSGKIAYTDGMLVRARAFRSGMTKSKVARYYVEPEYSGDMTGTVDVVLVYDPTTGEFSIVEYNEYIGGGTQTETADNSSSSEIQGVFELINKERSAVGTSPLTLDPTLCSAADVRAKEIADYYSHTRPDGTDCSTILDEYGVSRYTSGENIAYGMNTLFTAEEVMNGWMNSSGHRANILRSSFGRVGIGRYRTGSYVYWVQIFTD